MASSSLSTLADVAGDAAATEGVEGEIFGSGLPAVAGTGLPAVAADAFGESLGAGFGSVWLDVACSGLAAVAAEAFEDGPVTIGFGAAVGSTAATGAAGFVRPALAGRLGSGAAPVPGCATFGAGETVAVADDLGSGLPAA